MRPSEKSIPSRTSPGRRTTTRVRDPAGSTQPDPLVSAQYGVKWTCSRTVPGFPLRSKFNLAG